MKFASTLAIGAALLASGGLLAVPAAAQKKNQAAQPAAWAPKMSKEEVTAMQAVEKAIAAKDFAAATTALTAAQAIAKSADARYFVGQFQYVIGQGTNNQALQSQGLDAMVASGGGDPSKMVPVFRLQGQLAMQAKDYAKAEAAYGRWAQLAPNDPDVVLTNAEVKFRQNKPQEALALFQRAISAQEAAGQQPDEKLYLFALQSAANAKMWPEALTLSKSIVTRFPTQKNWRNALVIFRQSGTTMDQPQQLDMLRLMRSAKALDTSDEFLALGDLLARGRFYSEAKAVIEEGFASGKLPRGNADAASILKEVSPRIAEDRTALTGLEGRARSGANGEFALKVAEGYFGHADYAKAADFYRLALQKGGVDANLVNSRLGIALALAGQRPAAETAFKSVTGPRTALASYWLLWLSQRG